MWWFHEGRYPSLSLFRGHKFVYMHPVRPIVTQSDLFFHENPVVKEFFDLVQYIFLMLFDDWKK